MKRKVYNVQSAIGQNSVAYAFNSAVRKGEAMLKEYALSAGLTGEWHLDGSGLERNEAGIASHGWRTYTHPASGKGFRFVVNLAEA